MLEGMDTFPPARDGSGPDLKLPPPVPPHSRLGAGDLGDSPDTHPHLLTAALAQSAPPRLVSPETLPGIQVPPARSPYRRHARWTLAGLLGLLLLAGGLLLWQRQGTFGVSLTRREPRIQDLPAVLKACNEKVLRWVIVELDYCDCDMLDAVAQSYTYLTKNGLAKGRI